VTLTQMLLAWYDLHGRDLPWRRNPTPYSILVSEIMLQQTRVEAVLPTYERFMQRFPTLQDLAAASQDETLTFWQGLGYYSRARRLHQAAQIIASEHQGRIPDDRRILRSLPGIGDYTCGAILSMAFSQSILAMDGNLLRVGARLFVIEEPINRMKAKGQIQTKFEAMIPAQRPGDFNQALMDLGSEVCLPRQPRCQACPISRHCQAFLQDRTLDLPRKVAPKAPLPVQVHVYLVESKGFVLLRKRTAGGFLQGLWELPWHEAHFGAGRFLPSVAEESHWLLSCLKGQDPLEVRRMDYVFSHRHWFMTIFCHALEEPFYLPREENIQYRWQPWETMEEIALPTVFKRALKARP